MSKLTIEEIDLIISLLQTNELSFTSDFQAMIEKLVYMKNHGISNAGNRLIIYRSGFPCGVVGTPTGLRDILGKCLFVGDTVKVLDKGYKCVGKEYIVNPSHDLFQPNGYGVDWKEDGSDGYGKVMVKVANWSECMDGDDLDNCIVIEEDSDQ